MGFLGNRPALARFETGASSYGWETEASGSYDPEQFGLSASAMLSGKANRIYYGDPLYRPFAGNRSPELDVVDETVTEVGDDRLDIDLVVDKPAVYFPMWDKFHGGGARIYTTVDVPGRFAAGVSVEVRSASGAYDRVIHGVERLGGATVLHLEIDLPGDNYGLDAIAFTIGLRISPLAG